MSNDSGVTIREWKPKVYNGDVICLLYRKVGTKKTKNKQNCFILKSTMKEKNTQNSSELFKVTILWILIFHSASDNQVHPAHFPRALCPLAALSKSSCCTYDYTPPTHYIIGPFSQSFPRTEWQSNVCTCASSPVWRMGKLVQWDDDTVLLVLRDFVFEPS